MQAVILAAGKGKRLRPLTLRKPKPLLEVAGRPILEHLLDSLPDRIDEIIMVVGYLSDQIKDYFGPEYKGCKIRYAPQKKLLGTFDALCAAKRYLKNHPFLCMVGDDFYDPGDLQKLTEHNPAMLVIEKEDPGRFNICIEKNGYLYDIVANTENHSNKT